MQKTSKKRVDMCILPQELVFAPELFNILLIKMSQYKLKHTMLELADYTASGFQKTPRGQFTVTYSKPKVYCNLKFNDNNSKPHCI